MKATRTLEELRRARPEWGAWLALVAEVQAAAATPAWRDVVVEAAPNRPPDVPLLDGAVLCIDPGAAERLVRRLFEVAAEHAPAATHDGARAAGRLGRGVDPLEFIASGLASDIASLLTEADGVPPDRATLATLASLAAVPAAQACARAHPPRAGAWTAPYCPICGAWPAFAEERGLERSRRYRCGTCSTEWWSAWLTCPFCGETNHERLGILTVEGDGTRRVDVCRRCDGYVKTVIVLGAAPDVALLDADTVELDLAARAQGYTRPDAPGHRARCTVTARPGLARRLLSWTR